MLAVHRVVRLPWSFFFLGLNPQRKRIPGTIIVDIIRNIVITSVVNIIGNIITNRHRTRMEMRGSVVS